VYRQAFYTGSPYDPFVRTETHELYFVRPGLTYVHDNALFGYTGPISGGRSSYSVDVSFGDIQSSRWIFDRRSYFNIRQRYALALRLIGATSHGRDPQVFRVGGPYTLRGYDYGELAGRNVGLLNVEFRFPMIEMIQLGWPLPIGLQGIRGAAFFDAGAAWRRNSEFRAVSTDGGFHLEDIHAAYGLNATINIGFAVLRWDLAWPTDFKHHRDPRGTFSIGSDF
jgi:outer membrane protein assembly factor BamA